MSSSTVRPAPLALASRRAETFRFRLALSSHRARRVPSRAVLARCSNASSSPSRTSAATEAFALGASLASDPIPLASLASNSAAQDAFDVVVWGATGFTGRLVARHLARHAPPSLRWAVAARSDDKLRALVGELVDRGDAETLVPMFHGDAADADDMTGLAAVSRCVISAAGPYGAHGGVLVGACARAGSRLADLTGEPGWMRAVIDAHDAVARDTGAMIVPCAGFDSVPSDVGSYRAAAELTRRHPGAKTRKVTTFLTKVLGGFSGGTLSTGWRLAEDPVERSSFCDVDGLIPGSIPGVSDRSQRPLAFAELEPRYDRDLRAWATSRPSRLATRRWCGAPSRCSTRGPTPMRAQTRAPARTTDSRNFATRANSPRSSSARPSDGRRGKSRAASLIEAAVRGAADDDTRRRMKAALPKAGEGPPEWFRESGFWEMRFRAEGANGERVWTRMAGGAIRGTAIPAGYSPRSACCSRRGRAKAARSKEDRAGCSLPRLRSGTPYYPGSRSTASRTRWKETSPEASGFDSNGLFSEEGTGAGERTKEDGFVLALADADIRPPGERDEIYIHHARLDVYTYNGGVLVTRRGFLSRSRLGRREVFRIDAAAADGVEQAAVPQEGLHADVHAHPRRFPARRLERGAGIPPRRSTPRTRSRPSPSSTRARI